MSHDTIPTTIVAHVRCHDDNFPGSGFTLSLLTLLPI